MRRFDYCKPKSTEVSLILLPLHPFKACVPEVNLTKLVCENDPFCLGHSQTTLWSCHLCGRFFCSPRRPFRNSAATYASRYPSAMATHETMGTAMTSNPTKAEWRLIVIDVSTQNHAFIASKLISSTITALRWDLFPLSIFFPHGSILLLT